MSIFNSQQIDLILSIAAVLTQLPQMSRDQAIEKLTTIIVDLEHITADLESELDDE